MSTQATILAIDDEADILELLRFTLEREGFAFMSATDGETGLRMLQNSRGSTTPELLILDLMMPGLDGLAVCKRLKANNATKSIPILMLTAKSSEADEVIGLELGADDYLAKPFSPRVLLARVKSLLRRFNEGEASDSTQIFEAGPFRIDAARHEVWVEHRLVELSATEFAMLAVFVQNPGLVFSRSRLIDSVHGKGYAVTERSVDVQILGLRKKLGPAGDAIQTVRGVGYRLGIGIH